MPINNVTGFNRSRRLHVEKKGTAKEQKPLIVSPPTVLTFAPQEPEKPKKRTRKK